MIAETVTIEGILAWTCPEDPSDYREHGRRALVAARPYPDLIEAEALISITAKARARAARLESRTADGIARSIADAETGQMSLWATWVDPRKVRATGRRLMAEADQKHALGRRMLQAADCMDEHEGLSARDAWIAEGLNPVELDAAVEVPA